LALAGCLHAQTGSSLARRQVRGHHHMMVIAATSLLIDAGPDR